MNDNLPDARITEIDSSEALPSSGARATTHASPALARALRATPSPRRNAAIPTYERSGALRERRRLAIGALSIALGLLVVGLFLLWEARNASGVTYSHWGPLGKAAGDDYDEGAYVLAAQSVIRGYALFSQVFSAQPAFFLPSLALALRFIHDPVVAAHLYEAAAGALTLLAVFLMAARAYRPLAGPFAAALLAVSPGFLLYAHAVESEAPMMAFCTLAVAAAQWYYLRPRRVGAALLVLLLFAPGAQWDQVIVFHLRSGRVPATVLPPSLGSNGDALKTFLGYDVGLLVAAGAGLVVALLWAFSSRGAGAGRTAHAGAAPASAHKVWLPLVYLLWALSTGLFLLRYHPLFQHQFLPLLPPLALLGGGLVMAWPAPTLAQRNAPSPSSPLSSRERGGASRVIRQGSSPLPRTGRGVGGEGIRRIALPIAAIGLLIYAVILVRSTLNLDGHLFKPAVASNRAALIALIDRTTRPGDYVVCDDPNVALGARRPVPPGLEDPSRVRAASGYLTVARLEAATVRYHAAVIVASRPMFARYLPAYLTWAAAHYRAVLSPVSGAQVFLRR
ncbi:MAG: hypothetical protein LC769_08135 [Chloroflexi bacterium]|nr:hypothetical protein [Chloroflexota bacterium]